MNKTRPQLSIRVNRELEDAFNRLARLHGLTKSRMLYELINFYLAHKSEDDFFELVRDERERMLESLKQADKPDLEEHEGPGRPRGRKPGGGTARP